MAAPRWSTDKIADAEPPKLAWAVGPQVSSEFVAQSVRIETIGSMSPSSTSTLAETVPGTSERQTEHIVITRRRTDAVEATLDVLEIGLPHEVPAGRQLDDLVLEGVETVALGRPVTEADLEGVVAGLAQLGVDDDEVLAGGTGLVVEPATWNRVLDVGADLGDLDRPLRAGISSDHAQDRVEVGLLRAKVDEDLVAVRADPIDVLGARAPAPPLGPRAAAQAPADDQVLAGGDVDRHLARSQARLDHATGARGTRGAVGDIVVDTHRAVVRVGPQAATDGDGDSGEGQANAEVPKGQRHVSILHGRS